MRLVTEKVLLEMKKITNQHGTTFVMVLLYADTEAKSHYMSFCRANNIPCVDCIYPITSEMQVPGEGHPNGKMNSLWAERIANELAVQKIIGNSPKP